MLKTYIINHISGVFKDEGAGVPFTEAVALRAKMYSLRSTKSKLSKTTAKGIPRAVKDNVLNHEEYVKALYQNTSNTLSIVRFESKKHSVYTVNLKKKGLSNFNDKIQVYMNEKDSTYTPHSFGYDPQYDN